MTRSAAALPRQASLSEYLSKYPDAQLVWIGYRIFKWLLLLTVAVMIALGTYAATTFPTADDIKGLLPAGASSADIFRFTRELRGAWVSDIKDLAQVFLLTPVFPLLATVVGYIFGRSHSVQAGDGPAHPASDEPAAEPR
jgi:hypothetical protein